MTAPTVLESGWRQSTPEGDTVLRRFLLNQGDLAATLATAVGGQVERSDAATMAYADVPVPYLNQAVLHRPVEGPDDPLLDAVDRFLGARAHHATVLSAWPTPNLAARGWLLLGHPAFVVRAPGPVIHVAPADVVVEGASSTDDLIVAERVIAEGYPMPEASDCMPLSVLGADLLDGPVSIRLGRLDGAAVAVAAGHVGRGVVNLCLAATLPAARRRGVWATLVWARVNDAPRLPAVAFTSDDSRPGFERMGFLPVTRFTLWLRPAG